jgi:hypothetical protein
VAITQNVIDVKLITTTLNKIIVLNVIKLSNIVWPARYNIIVLVALPTKPLSNMANASHVKYSTLVAKCVKIEIYAPIVYLMPTTSIFQPANARPVISPSHTAKPAIINHTV